jgi:predicted dehydrogenase
MTTGENADFFHVAENAYHFLGTSGSLGFPKMQVWHYPDRARSGWQYPLEQSCQNVERAEPLTRQIQHFARVVRGEETPVVDARDGAQSLAVALAILQSSQEHAPIRVATAAAAAGTTAFQGRRLTGRP